MLSVFRPSITQREIDAVVETLRSGWIGLGPKTAEFETRFAEFVQVPHAVGTSSDTAALTLALQLLDVGPGDEVLVPTITFVSTAHVACYNGATPVFVDVDRQTLNIDLADAQRRLTPRTKAVIPVHYSGRPVDITALRAAVGAIAIVEDCAHAAGSLLHGRPVGSLGDIGCFSFHAVKNIAMGDGGALVCSRPDWAARAKRLRWMGIDQDTWKRSWGGKTYGWEYRVTEIGNKLHMNDIAAALGLVQLERLQETNGRRQQIVRRYFDELSDLPWLQLPPPDTPTSQSAWHLFCVQCDCRDDLATYLMERGVSTSVHYYPIHMHPCYGNSVTLPVAEEVWQRILTLPLYPDMTDADVALVTGLIREFEPEAAS